MTVRMYRQGHGDCFLLATRKQDGAPFFMVIDCGLWKGSEVEAELTIDKVVADIAESTDSHIDVLLITHEHMDHVSGFNAEADDGTALWARIEVDEVWLAWTEDEKDEDARALRQRFDDVLLGLAAAVEGASGLRLKDTSRRASLIRDVLQLHTGEDSLAPWAALAHARGLSIGSGGDSMLAAVPGWSNKKAIKRMRDQASRRVHFLSPGEVHGLPGVEGARVYALGPPRDPRLLLSLDPKGKEEFKFGIAGSSRLMLQALARAQSSGPFNPRFSARLEALEDEDKAFMEEHYGFPGSAHSQEWRRIDDEWEDAAEGLALRLNDEVNNTSLVIAIELTNTGKVLLFTGDAQRGSWVSWSNLRWKVGREQVTARDLLRRVVLLKVGHHGSHNATLNGSSHDEVANLSWLARDGMADEFVAMIPANKGWAARKKPKAWRHPFKAIEEALLEKAQGRVLRMDEAEPPHKPPGVSQARWNRFRANTQVTDSYLQYTVTDD